MEQEKFKAILIFGPQGSGKGTQAKLLAEKDSKYFHFSTGDMFRALKNNNKLANSDIGKKVLENIDQGHLAPDDLTIKLLFETLEEYVRAGKLNKNQILILDGIPRNINQTKLLKEKVDILKIIYLYSSNEQELIKRIIKRAEIENRADDKNSESIAKRLEIYKNETAPILNEYSKDLIIEVDAMPSIEDIQSDILSKLK